MREKLATALTVVALIVLAAALLPSPGQCYVILHAVSRATGEAPEALYARVAQALPAYLAATVCLAVALLALAAVARRVGGGAKAPLATGVGRMGERLVLALIILMLSSIIAGGAMIAMLFGPAVPGPLYDLATKSLPLYLAIALALVAAPAILAAVLGRGRGG